MIHKQFILNGQKKYFLFGCHPEMSYWTNDYFEVIWRSQKYECQSQHYINYVLPHTDRLSFQYSIQKCGFLYNDCFSICWRLKKNYSVRVCAELSNQWAKTMSHFHVNKKRYDERQLGFWQELLNRLYIFGNLSNFKYLFDFAEFEQMKTINFRD